jgi:hypothetical protein
MTISCKHCGKKIEYEQRAGGRPREFCGTNCCSNWQYHNNPKANARVKAYTHARYQKIKNTPEYKAQRKACFNRWLAKNRARFNELMREPNRLRNRAMRIIAKKNGMCPRCFKRKKLKNMAICKICKDKYCG